MQGISSFLVPQYVIGKGPARRPWSANYGPNLSAPGRRRSTQGRSTFLAANVADRSRPALRK